MRRWIIYLFLLGVIGAPLFAGQAAQAQAQQHSSSARLELVLTYTASRANFVPGTSFWMQGGDAEVAGRIGHGFSAVGSFAGMHAGPGTSGIPLSMMVESFGPR